jgi:hypothetical protein
MQKEHDPGTDIPETSTGRTAIQPPEPLRLIEGLSGLERFKAQKKPISSKITDEQIEWLKMRLGTEM